MNTPFQNLNAIQGLGTAPALESIDLAEEVPIAENPHEINREATRYIGFAGDIITPSQKRERPDLRLGGEYLGQNFKTLVRSKGLVRRCQITPMEVGFDFFSADMLGDDANLHVVTTVEHNENGRGALQASPGGRLNGVKVYPGDELKGLMAANNDKTNKGFVEFTQLAGVEYKDFKASGLQEFVFPEWKDILLGVGELPIKLSELELHFRTRRNDTSDDSIKGILDAWLQSCDIYRNWGMNYLKFSSQLVKLPAYQGHLFTYSELAEMLFIQLEVRREDLISSDRDLAEIVAKASAGNAISTQDVMAVMDKLAESQGLIAQLLAGQQNPPAVEKVQCSALNAKGEQCGASPVENSEFCRHHQPVTAEV